MKIIKENIKKHPKKNIIIFFILLFLLFLTLIYFVHSLEFSYNSGELNIHHRNQGILSNQINGINTWMTFDYINVVFKLPPDYLKDRLAITDPRYPNIRIDRCAKGKGENKQQLLLEIQQLVIQNINGRI